MPSNNRRESNTLAQNTIRNWRNTCIHMYICLPWSIRIEWNKLNALATTVKTMTSRQNGLMRCYIVLCMHSIQHVLSECVQYAFFIHVPAATNEPNAAHHKSNSMSYRIFDLKIYVRPSESCRMIHHWLKEKSCRNFVLK